MFFSRSGVSDSATPWTVARQGPPSMGFPGKNTGVGWHFLLQGIFPTQGSNLSTLLGRQILYHWATSKALCPYAVQHILRAYFKNFLNLIFTVYWSRVDLQCRAGLRYTAKWLYTYIHIYAFFFRFLITVYWADFPVLYIRPCWLSYTQKCIYVNSRCVIN